MRNAHGKPANCELRTANCELRTANCERIPTFAELVSLTPGIVARIAPDRWREELAQQVLYECWVAVRNGSVVRSPRDYVRTAARRAFARLQRTSLRLSFDTSLLEDIPSQEQDAQTDEFGAWRGRLKASLDDRHRRVYEHYFECRNSLRVTGNACGLDQKQVQRCLENIHKRRFEVRCTPRHCSEVAASKTT